MTSAPTIEVGMTKKEVIQLLGEPRDDGVVHGADAFLYFDKHPTLDYSIRFSQNKVVSVKTYEKETTTCDKCGKDNPIGVVFVWIEGDIDQRVTRDYDAITGTTTTTTKSTVHNFRRQKQPICSRCLRNQVVWHYLIAGIPFTVFFGALLYAMFFLGSSDERGISGLGDVVIGLILLFLFLWSVETLVEGLIAAKDLIITPSDKPKNRYQKAFFKLAEAKIVERRKAEGKKTRFVLWTPDQHARAK